MVRLPISLSVIPGVHLSGELQACLKEFTRGGAIELETRRVGLAEESRRRGLRVVRRR